MNNLKQGADFDNLYRAANCRDKADWLVGMNMSRLFMTPVGRVKTPTLALVVNRELDIKNFVESYSYTVGLLKDGLEFTSDRFEDEDKANNLKNMVSEKQAKITKVDIKETKSNPPKLFDLVALQREANKLFSYSAKETLDILQKLYEAKLLTYPRTDSRFITNDMETSTISIINNLFNIKDLKNFLIEDFDINKIINDKKVSDHHAVLPTEQLTEDRLNSLSEKERNIALLVATRLIIAVSSPEVAKSSKIHVLCEESIFTLSHKEVLVNGYKELENKYKTLMNQKLTEEEIKKENLELPGFKENDIFDNFETKINQIKATPPKTFTEDTLLSAMEHAGNEYIDDDTEKKGIGTPATMGNIIEELITRNNFLERNGRQVTPTENGYNLIKLLPTTLTSPKMTADWETFLQRIEKGEADKDNFIKDIKDFINRHITQFDELTDEQKKLIPKRKTNTSYLGNCPKCKEKQVIIGKKTYFCEDRENCKFVLFKEPIFFTKAKKNFTQKMAKDLITKGKISVKGLTSAKTNKKYDATIVLDIDEEKGYGNFKLEF